MAVYIGCSGYHYKHWKERFYPEEIPQKDWLSFYAGHFNSVEINNSFYKLPDAKTFKNWYKQVPDDFRFAVKGSRYVTHMKQLVPDKKLADSIDMLYDRAVNLEDKLGCVLWQLPPRMGKNMEKLENFCEQISRGGCNVIEFRNEEWFCEEVYGMLKKYRVGLCLISEPEKLSEDLKKTSGAVYMRFHGTQNWYADDYPESELKTWRSRLKKLKGEDYWIYFNNDHQAYAVKNAKMLQNLW